MADFVEPSVDVSGLESGSDAVAAEEPEALAASEATATSTTENTAAKLIDASNPVEVIYCPHCTLPPEYCEYGQLYAEKCRPWIIENMPELLGEARIAQLLSAATLDEPEEVRMHWLSLICLILYVIG